MFQDKIFKLGRPCIYIITMDEALYSNMFTQLSLHHRQAVIRIIRGNKSRLTSDFFNEVSSALQFPYYFGGNWAAFNDCITDLDWLEGEAYLLMVDDAIQLLSDDHPDNFLSLINLFSEANELWLTPNKYIPRNREPTPFHVLFRCSESDTGAFIQKLRATGIEFEKLETPSVNEQGVFSFS